MGTSGRAELSRLLFHYGQIAFEDERISHEEFTKRKDTFPFKQLPVLQIDDDIVIAQSSAIVRYATELVGLTPKDPVLMAQVEMTLEALKDFGEAYVNMAFYTFDEKLKEEKKKKLVEQTLPLIFGKIEKYATENGVIHGDTLTAADFDAYYYIEYLLSPHFDTFQPSDYPKLQKVVTKVKNLPQLSAYLNKTE